MDVPEDETFILQMWDHKSSTQLGFEQIVVTSPKGKKEKLSPVCMSTLTKVSHILTRIAHKLVFKTKMIPLVKIASLLR